MRTGGVVLAGGASRRMGTAKAGLAWHGSTLLQRTAAVVGRSADGPVVVVGAPGQDLPSTPDAEVVDDPVAGRGPLQGVAAGLAALRDRADVAFVCATDLPWLHPAVVRAVLAALLADPAAEAAVPLRRGQRQPLAAAYRVHLAGRAADLVATGAGPRRLLAACAVRELDERTLLDDPAVAAADPDLASLEDVDDEDAYRAALAAPPPLVRVRTPEGVEVEVRAGTAGDAVAAVLPAGSAGDGTTGARAGARALLDGRAVPPTTPLVAGDVLEVALG